MDVNPWPLRIASMVKQEFLVATHLAWESTALLHNCLVTWEVYGGGLMGNLLTDSCNVELSLWPDTKYRVQVTCKNKQTGHSVKSPAIIVNTSQAIAMKPESPSPVASDDIKNISNNMIPPMLLPAVFTAVPAEKWENLVPTEYSNSIEVKDTHSHGQQQSTQMPPPFVEKQNFAHHQPPLHHSANMFESKAVVLGVCAAVIMFLFILTMFCAFRGISARLRHGGAQDKADYFHQISVNIEER